MTLRQRVHPQPEHVLSALKRLEGAWDDPADPSSDIWRPHCVDNTRIGRRRLPSVPGRPRQTVWALLSREGKRPSNPACRSEQNRARTRGWLSSLSGRSRISFGDLAFVVL
jgi:hypothetical protein